MSEDEKKRRIALVIAVVLFVAFVLGVEEDDDEA
jgi:hypothetical protein